MSKTVKVIREDLSGVDFVQDGNIVASLELKDLDKNILTNLALHGASQKIGDSYAGVKESADVAAKATAVIERLVAGDWKAARAAASPKSTQLAEALASVFGKTVEEAVGVIAKLEKDQIADLRKDPRVKAALQTIAAERAAEKAKKANAEAKGADAGELGSLFG